MNERAHGLTARLRTLLGSLPGAASVGLHAFDSWAIVLITASSDEAVIALGEAFGLGTVTVRNAGGRWWRQASSEREREGGAIRFEVVGPRHLGSPPQHDPGDA